VAIAWDQHTEQSLRNLQNTLVRRQVRDSIASFSPLWRRRFAELNRNPAAIRTVDDLAGLPAMGERDVSPSGDPMGMSALVLQPDASSFTPSAPPPDPRAGRRGGFLARNADPAVYDAGSRPTTFVFSGVGFRYPIASTRGDVALVGQAGRRLWSVLGLTGDDVLLSAVPPGTTTEHVALQYAALASGAPALCPGSDAARLAATARLAPPSVLAVPTATAPQVLNGLSGLTSVRTLLLVGAPSDAERIAAAHAFSRAGGTSDTAILAVHAPAGARVLWGECRPSGGATGLHSYPDLELAQVIEPASGEASTAGGELVLTQLGFRGSALLRWRTGDSVARLTAAPCPACGRRVPRAEGLRREALVTQFESGRPLDLRSVSAVLSGRTDILDWRLVIGRRGRDGVRSAVIHFEAGDPDDPTTAIGVATDIRHVTGSLPTQLVAASREELAMIGGSALSPRILVD
jgi:hypothetical protein